MPYYPNEEESNALIEMLRLTWERYSMYDIDDEEFIVKIESAMRKAGLIED